MTLPDPKFQIHCALEAFEKADDPNGHTMRIGGVISTDEVDQQDERILQEGLDFTPFLSKGWFNDNHGQKTTDVVGYPTSAHYVRKGDRLPNGKIAHRNSWWAEGYLLNTDAGRELYQLAGALKGTPRQLGFSIEGSVVSRSARDSKVVTRAVVKNVAVTHCPVNVGTELHALAKALTAGSAISNPGAAPGEGFPLRGESLDKKRIADAAGHETENLTGADGDDPNDGGFAGVNPHKITKSEKVGEFVVAPMTEHEYLQDWTDDLHAAHGARADRLTKAEARIIVRARLPHLSDDQVDRLIANSSH